jgi:hypothetical protein
MNELNVLTELTQSSLKEADLFATMVAFLACVIMSFLVREFYVRRSFSLTGKSHIGSVIPILSTVVFMVILVVKSSLALSLGLVGALSIVRFRTPIKEPEELVYLFLAIAVGLGYGAGYVYLTTILTSLILLMNYFFLSNRKMAKNSEYNLVIKWKDVNVPFEKISKIMSDFSQSLKLVRLDRGSSGNGNTVVMLIVPLDDIDFDAVTSALIKLDPTLSLTFYEAKTNW